MLLEVELQRGMPLGSHQTNQKCKNKYIKIQIRTLKLHALNVAKKRRNIVFNIDLPATFDKVFPLGSVASLLNIALGLIQPS